MRPSFSCSRLVSSDVRVRVGLDSPMAQLRYMSTRIINPTKRLIYIRRQSSLNSYSLGIMNIGKKSETSVDSSVRHEKVGAEGHDVPADDKHPQVKAQTLQKLVMVENVLKQPFFSAALDLAAKEERPSIFVGFSSHSKSKRKAKIDLGTQFERRSHEMPGDIGLSQPETSPITSQLDEYSLPASFGKKQAISYNRRSKLHKTNPANPKGIGNADYPNLLPVFKPFDICLSKSRKPLELNASLDTNRWGKPIVMDQSVCNSGQILRPGMVLLKSYIPLSEQVEIVKKCRLLGLGPGGFYQPSYKTGAKLRLQMMCLGLNWDPETRKYEDKRPIDYSKPPSIPVEFGLLVKQAIQDCHDLIKQQDGINNVEDILPGMCPDICIVNFYSTNGRLGLHQDRDESKESLLSGLPVVSFSIGDSTEFLYGDQRDVDKAEKILLESGDVLIFGGRSRNIFHGVSFIVPNSAPSALLKEVDLRPGRLNLTFRKF